MEVKRIVLQTNYNGKLHCDTFTHIDVAPKGTITESIAENLVAEIYCKDNSHPPVKAKLVDLLRLPLHQLSMVLTWPSHGMTFPQYLDWITARSPSITLHTPMAIYFYQKIKN